MLTLMPDQTATFDRAVARREGWDVFDCGHETDGTLQLQLQRLDTSEDGEPPFPDDRDAWTFVVLRARAGYTLHRAALDAVDGTERMLIEAACGAW